ncbi:MAG TPA: S8 family serine peptidase, partial [Cytophagales bacterium]
MKAKEFNLLKNLSEATGRQLVFMKKGALREASALTSVTRFAKNEAGLTLAASSDFDTEMPGSEAFVGNEGVILEELGIAIVQSGDADKVAALSEAGPVNNFIRQVREEYFMYIDRYEIANLAPVVGTGGTWGLEVTNVTKSPWSGRDIKVAVLDTGFNETHTDFAGRHVIAKSFMGGEPFIDDLNGHGTHCIGTACGPSNAPVGRYGIAYNATIYAGKVMDGNGRGPEGGVLQGINWALENNCHVISLSLGRQLPLSMLYDEDYEEVGNIALRKGCLMVAAAGNESARDVGFVAPINSPANAPSIMAVAALNGRLKVADF